MSFENKLCIVTGAASGIGRAMALQLISQGATVALSDINEAGLKETLELSDKPRNNNIRTDVLDVSDPEAVIAYADSIEESFGGADYLFNVAGLTRVGSFEETSLEAFNKVMDVNFYGVVGMTKAFLPQLLQTRGGIVNISSVFGLIGYPNQSHYCASKFAVRGFTETLAQELKDKGVSVTSVHPGGVKTAIAKSAIHDGGDVTEEQRTVLNKNFDNAARTTAESAANTILTGALKKKRRITLGPDAKLISITQRLFPRSYAGVLSRIFPSVKN